MAAAVGSDAMQNRADFRRRLYVAFTIGFLLLLLAALAVPPVTPVTPIALFIGLPVGLITFCLMMGLMKGTANMCRGAVSL